MIRHVFGLLVVAAVASAQHGISFSRSVQGGPPNANGATDTLTADSLTELAPLLDACCSAHGHGPLRRAAPRWARLGFRCEGASKPPRVNAGCCAVGYLSITPGCSSTDQFGSNNCNLAWGSTVTIGGNVRAALPVSAPAP